MERKNLKLQIETDLDVSLTAYAKQTGTSAADIVRLAIVEYLNTHAGTNLDPPTIKWGGYRGGPPPPGRKGKKGPPK